MRLASGPLGAETNTYVDGRAVEQLDLKGRARVVIEVRDRAQMRTSLTRDPQMAAADRSLRIAPIDDTAQPLVHGCPVF